MKPTLGLTGLTMNAMALIAPGAFLWITYYEQANYGQPMAGSDIWFGIVAALALCFATALSYAELSKLYPGAGSSYFFAEQAFLSHTHAYRFARIAKFIIGWASHLYYWVYPGLMVGLTAIFAGYVVGQILPSVFNAGTPSPLFMILFSVVFAFGVAYIAYRGVTGATAVNITVNIIQISALLIFSVIAIGYRMNHAPDAAKPDGTPAYALEDGVAVTKTKVYKQQDKKDEDGKPVLDADKKPVTENVNDAEGNPIQDTVNEQKAKVGPDKKPVLGDDGKPVMEDVLDAKGNPIPVMEDGKPKLKFDDVVLNYKEVKPVDMVAPDEKSPKAETRQYFESSTDVIRPHGFGSVIIQACIAILILVGFESVTSMGEEAKNAKRDIPRAVLLSLLIQGVICYLFEYYAANYFLNPQYKLTDAAKSSAPIGDMMLLAATSLFGSQSAGKAFLLVEALTVFLALVGTTLACMNTGARVTYAMGRDDEVPSHFGMLHGTKLTPHRAIWTLAIISAVIGIVTVYFNFCGPYSAVADDDIAKLPKNVWYSFGIFKHDTAIGLPQSSLIVALVSNFGTFLLYMLTNIVAIVAFREHHTFSGIKHVVVPVFGLLANLLCMLFYLIAPIPWLGGVAGMSWKEPYMALGVALIWGVYGWWYFTSSSKAKGRDTFIGAKPEAAATGAAP
ncbi:MAG TPA: APC family permease [Gemmataceae bacterium]|nr:APC family permease [Gemmataceae bacterium]